MFTTIDNLSNQLPVWLRNLDQTSLTNFEKSCQEIAFQIAPKIFLDQKEENFPSSVDWFLERCNVYCFIDNQTPGEIISTDPIEYFQHYEGSKRLYLAPKEGLQEEVYKGNLEGAETYCRISLKDDSIFIQYWFFYPYNGGLNLELFHQRNQFEEGFYAHEGDWENICVEIKPKLNSSGEIEQVEVPSLRLFSHGDCSLFQDAYGITYNLDQLQRLVVYSCWHSHASMINFGRYDNPNLPGIIDILQRLDHRIGMYDYARPNGEQWDTQENLVFISSNTASNEHIWLKFKGNWGDEHFRNQEIFGFDIQLPIVTDGPTGPMQKSDWKEPDEPDFEGLVRPWCLNPELLNFEKFTSLEVSYYPQGNQSFRCSANFPEWNTIGNGLLKFEVLPDTNDGSPYPMPMFAITQDRFGSDERWYSYITDKDVISVHSGNGEPAEEKLYIGTNTLQDDWDNVASYPDSDGASYTVIVYKA